MSRRGPKDRAPAPKSSVALNAVDKPEEPRAPGKTGEVDDWHTFREAMRDVKPLEAQLSPAGVSEHPSGTGQTAHRSATAHARRVTQRRHSARRAAAALDTPPLGSTEDIVDGAERLAFRRAGVRDQVMRQLRRGLYPIEDELDLHGLNQAAARDVLAAFIAHQREAGHRCARIIHGKGYRSGAGGPILKILVNGWLKRDLDVMAFCSAREIDGGTGAVYVLLRR